MNTTSVYYLKYLDAIIVELKFISQHEQVSGSKRLSCHVGHPKDNKCHTRGKARVPIAYR